MKVYNVTFTGKQEFRSQMVIAAADEAAARSGMKALLDGKVDGFDIAAVEDITAVEGEGEAEVAANLN
jgi:hypothetical protein